jgi:hypothetical protein
MIQTIVMLIRGLVRLMILIASAMACINAA